MREHGVELDTPFGVAAGPHIPDGPEHRRGLAHRRSRHRAQDDPDARRARRPQAVHRRRPDEGYNVEWSQELRVHQSFDEYLRAWVLIHALHRRFGWPGETPGVALQHERRLQPRGHPRGRTSSGTSTRWPTRRRTCRRTSTSSPATSPAVRDIADPGPAVGHDHAVHDARLPARRDREDRRVPARGARASTPRSSATRPCSAPSSSGRSSTTTSASATCRSRTRPSGTTSSTPTPCRCSGASRRSPPAAGLGFGLKLSNTLEVENWRTVFDRDPTMYLSGRPLHAVTVNLAHRLSEEFGGGLPLSFAGGADCFNVADLLGSGMRTITVASDLLKTGGYLRLLQYTEKTDEAFDALGATSTADFIVRSAAAGGFAGAAGGEPATVAACARFNLRALRGGGAARLALPQGLVPDGPVEDGPRARRRSTASRRRASTPARSTRRCPLYMDAVRRGDLDEAIRITREDNPLPSILGRACDHLCETTCVRTHLDQPLAIRHIKRFIMDQETAAGRSRRRSRRRRGLRVAIIGAGPAGLAAARELARAGVRVTIFEAQPLRRRHGRRRDPGVPAAAGTARPGPGGPRSARRGDPLRRAGRRRRHARRAPRGRLRRDLRRRRRAGRQAARPARRGRGGDRRRGHVPARCPRGPADARSGRGSA